MGVQQIATGCARLEPAHLYMGAATTPVMLALVVAAATALTGAVLMAHASTPKRLRSAVAATATGLLTMAVLFGAVLTVR